MTIPQSRYIKIRNLLTQDRSVSRRNLSGLVLTTNSLAPFGYIIEMGSANDVQRYFGSSSREYGFAKAYFSAVGYGNKVPDRISFTRYTRASDGIVYPTMMSQNCSIDLQDYNRPIGGDTTLVLRTTEGTYELTLPSSDTIEDGVVTQKGLSSCVCLTEVCGVYNTTASNVLNPSWVRQSELSFENGRFFLRFNGGIDGEILPCGETPLAVSLGLTEAYNVVVSDGGGDANGLVGAISRVAKDYDDFGSFCFLRGNDEIVQWNGSGSGSYWDGVADEISKVDGWLAAENYRFMGVFGFSYLHSRYLDGRGFGYSTHLVLFDASNYSYEEAEAMGILSTIDYDSQYEAEYSWMFRSNVNLIPLPISTESSYEFTQKNLNFYGQTQEVGAVRCFYQPGKNADGSDTSAVCAEIWLKDAIQTAIINRLLNGEKVSSSDNGVEIIGDDISDVLSEVVFNGMITVPTTLTNVQKIYINRCFDGNVGASVEIERDGYCLSLSYSGETVNYRLLYHKNGNFRMIDGTHVV